jgi:hypothetical protein
VRAVDAAPFDTTRRIREGWNCTRTVVASRIGHWSTNDPE